MLHTHVAVSCFLPVEDLSVQAQLSELRPLTSFTRPVRSALDLCANDRKFTEHKLSLYSPMFIFLLSCTLKLV